MEALVVLAVTFVLLWVLFILPQQRRVRGHQALVASLQPGDHVVLTAGIHGRIVDLGHEDMTVEVAPGVELRVARQAVLRRDEDVTGAPAESPAAGGLPVAGTTGTPGTPAEADPVGPPAEPPAAAPTLPPPDAPPAEGGPDTDDRGPATPGPAL